MLSNKNTEMQLKVAQLCKAIGYYSDPKITKQLLEKTVDVNYVLPDQCSIVASQSKVKSSSLLHLAYVKGNIDIFELLIKSGADFTIKDQDGSTALHLIVEEIQQQNASLLDNLFVNMILFAHIENQNYANPSNKSKLSHFHVALMANQVELIKLFIENGISIDQSIDMNSPIKPGYSSLHFAAEHCSLEIMKFFISIGANMHLKNASGFTPLHSLIKSRLEMFGTRHSCKGEKSIEAIQEEMDLNEKMINLLLENDSTDTECTDHIGLTNFHAACTLQSSIVECLLDRVVDINQRVNQDSPLCPGYTALHFAAHCSVNTVSMLIERGADMMACDAKGVTPFEICMKWYKAEEMCSVADSRPLLWHSITFSNNKTKLLDCIYAMLDSDKLEKFLHDNIDLNIHLPQASLLWPGSTPLHLAFRFNKQQMVSSLLEIQGRVWKDAINILDEDRLSYLHIACSDKQYGHRLAMKILSMKRSVKSMVNASYQGQPLSKLKSGWTPLHVAAVEGQVSLVEALLESGADVNCKDSKGFSPIHLMFSTENVKIVEHLLASKNLQECVLKGAGLTHLHVAIWFRNNKVAARLIQMGADIDAIIKCELNDNNLKELEGCAPLHLAMIKNDPTSVRMLLRLGANIFAKRFDGVSPLSEALIVKDEIIVKLFWELIQNDEKLQKRLEEDFGLTMLHIACCVLDVNVSETLLRDKSVDVNAKTHDDLNIWPGFTPLHVLIESYSNTWRKGFYDIFDLLLQNGADVTVKNADQCTPVHLEFNSWGWRSKSTEIKSMLEHQQDFSVNPVDKDGISHFHCACAIYDLECVENFLQQNRIDVNQRIDFFAAKHSGCSPLHLVLSSSITNFRDSESQQRIVELLLQHGAKIDLEDSYGQTPLHVLIQEIENPRRLSFMKIIISRSEQTDVNMRTISGKTPMEILLSAHGLYKDVDIWLGELELLISSGGRINACNPITEEGYIALAFSNKNCLTVRPKIFQIIKKTFGFSGSDEMNRNSIHNVVATSHELFTSRDYEVIIELCIQNGCDIDKKDNTGKTPLHLAAQFGNNYAVIGLLASGADINIIDSAGNSAFSYALERCQPVDYSLISIISLHVQKLTLIGIEISELNESLLMTALKVYNIGARFPDMSNFCDKIRETENIKISRRGLTLHSFLRETAAISVYPSLMPIEREEVENFFKSFDYRSCRELAFAILLQYRKAKMRSSLITQAENSFKGLLDFPLPDLCIEIILKFLRNSDLKNLIAAHDDKNDMNMVVD